MGGKIEHAPPDAGGRDRRGFAFDRTEATEQAEPAFDAARGWRFEPGEIGRIADAVGHDLEQGFGEVEPRYLRRLERGPSGKVRRRIQTERASFTGAAGATRPLPALVVDTTGMPLSRA